MTLFERGHFTLASGASSAWKIECDALGPDDWDGLAAMLAERLPGFRNVIGVPRGGVPFAGALDDYTDPDARLLLVVDDVWTTGGSMGRFIDKLGFHGPIIRAVVFARNPVPDGVTALFQMA